MNANHDLFAHLETARGTALNQSNLFLDFLKVIQISIALDMISPVISYQRGSLITCYHFLQKPTYFIPSILSLSGGSLISKSHFDRVGHSNMGQSITELDTLMWDPL